MGARAYSLIGTVYMALLDSNKARVGGFKKVGNVYPFSCKVATEQKKQISRMKETAGQTLHAKTVITDTAGAMNIREWIPESLAWALSGGAAAMTAASGSVAVGTPESITAALGAAVPLAHKNVSSVVIKDVTDATTYIAGTDYNVISPALGLIEVLVGGAIADGAVLHASYSYAAESGYQVNIGSNALIRVAIMIDGKNEEDGTPLTMDFDSVVLASSADINLISDPGTDYEELPFTLTFETLPGATSPGRINGVPL